MDNLNRILMWLKTTPYEGVVLGRLEATKEFLNYQHSVPADKKTENSLMVVLGEEPVRAGRVSE